MRHRAVVQDRELVGLVLAGRDALGDGGILLAWCRRDVRTWRAVSSDAWLRPVSSHSCDDGPVTRPAWGARLLRYPSPVPDPLGADPADPRLVIVMPAYNAARTLERTYADIPHDLVDRIILVDDVSRDADGRDRAAARARRHHPQPEPRLRRQPEDVLRRGPRCRAPRSSSCSTRLPVRRDAHPRPDRPDRRRIARPDARQPVPGRSAGRRDAALEVRQPTGS